MKCHRKSVRDCTASLAAGCLIALVSGCASPGPARPPSLRLPQVVTDLTAIRTGDNVAFHWTTPDKTTDGLKVQLPLTAEICRESPAPARACIAVKRLAVRPGPSETFDTLPASLVTGPAGLLTYRLQILNSNNHSAGLSTPVFAVAGAAPPPVRRLRATPVREGAMLEWQPEPSQSLVELDRVLVQTAAPRQRSAKQPLHLAPSNPTEVRLRAGKPSADPGGTIDPTAQRGETYRYTAQRVQTVVLNGHTLELRSALSPMITVAIRDSFPPKAPSGLAAVPGAGTIDLSWEPNTESDLAGYIVYRQTAPSGTAVRLTRTPVPAPAFSDHTAQPGQIYSYRVTAIDAAGNESPASAEVQESLRSQ